MDRMTMPPVASATDPLALALKREMRAGERIRWQGRQLARVSRTGFGLYFFAIPWTAFALFWTAMASLGAGAMQEDAGLLSWAFPLFGVPFILVGVAMLSAPFLPLFNRGKVIFAVTDQRVLRIRVGRKLDIKSVPARRIGQIDRSENRDGSGSLKIAVSVGLDSVGDKQTEHFELGDVEDILGAHDEIAELGRGSAK